MDKLKLSFKAGSFALVTLGTGYLLSQTPFDGVAYDLYNSVRAPTVTTQVAWNSLRGNPNSYTDFLNAVIDEPDSPVKNDLIKRLRENNVNGLNLVNEINNTRDVADKFKTSVADLGVTIASTLNPAAQVIGSGKESVDSVTGGVLSKIDDWAMWADCKLWGWTSDSKRELCNSKDLKSKYEEEANRRNQFYNNVIDLKESMVSRASELEERMDSMRRGSTNYERDLNGLVEEIVLYAQKEKDLYERIREMNYSKLNHGEVESVEGQIMNYTGDFFSVDELKSLSNYVVGGVGVAALNNFTRFLSLPGFLFSSFFRGKRKQE